MLESKKVREIHSSEERNQPILNDSFMVVMLTAGEPFQKLMTQGSKVFLECKPDVSVDTIIFVLSSDVGANFLINCNLRGTTGGKRNLVTDTMEVGEEIIEVVEVEEDARMTVETDVEAVEVVRDTAMIGQNLDPGTSVSKRSCSIQVMDPLASISTGKSEQFFTRSSSSGFWMEWLLVLRIYF